MDLMVLDIMMPHLDGFSVCKMAREMSSLPIIMLTAKSDEEDKLKGYEYGADDYKYCLQRQTLCCAVLL